VAFPLARVLGAAAGRAGHGTSAFYQGEIVTDFGTVRRDGDFGAVRFERLYAVSPEQLWDAWTSPARISRWLGATLTGRLTVGATAMLVWGDDPDSQVELVVNELKPPELLEWEWRINGERPTVLRVELSPAPGGTLLVLDHSGLPSSMFPGLSAGWHDFLDVLGSGQPAEDRWRELLPAYREQVAAL
jgi:uncharacterized protein YndB with AHSA1/START domain